MKKRSEFKHTALERVKVSGNYADTAVSGLQLRMGDTGTKTFRLLYRVTGEGGPTLRTGGE